MNKLIIKTCFPATVTTLLKKHQLVDGLPHVSELGATDLEVYYPDDLLGQALIYWFAMTIGCGLVDSFELIHAPGPHHQNRLDEITHIADAAGLYD
jgi:hypothetical protein